MYILTEEEETRVRFAGREDSRPNQKIILSQIRLEESAKEGVHNRKFHAYRTVPVSVDSTLSFWLTHEPLPAGADRPEAHPFVGLSPMKRSRLEIGKAILRLSQEPLVSICLLSTEAGVSCETLKRWIISGRGGQFLDGVHRPEKGWLSSRAALARFQGSKVPAS